MAKNLKPSYSTRLLDLLAVICLVLLAIVLTIFFQLHFFVSTLFFFGLPSAYLIWRKPSNFKKSFLGGILFGVIWGFAFDYVAEFNHAWGWSTNTDLTFPISFFGVVSLDIMVWYFLWIFFIIAFYEYFAEYDFSKRVSKNFIPAIVLGIIASALVVLVSKIAPSVVTFQYPYLVLGIIAFFVFALIVIRKPRIYPKVMEIIPFFIFVYLSFELTALYQNLWSFPGHYIGSVTIFNLSFPFEELLFWIVGSSAVAAAYHENCIDNGK